MSGGQTWGRDGVEGAGYFGLALLSILTARFDNGLAYVWFASPFLITALLRRPRRQWTRPVIVCAIGSFVASGSFGVGWGLAPFVTAANMAEALVAAYFLRVVHNSLLRFGSLRWFVNVGLFAGFAGPAAMSAVAMIPLWYATGSPPAETLTRVLVGHGVSNLTFIPIFKLFATGGSSLWRSEGERAGHRVLPLFAIQAVVTVGVFAQDELPLMFLPILPVVAMAFGGNSRRIAASLLLLAGLAGAMTLAGFGPVNQSGATSGHEIQFLQFYMMVTVMTIIPIAAGLRSRSRLSRQVRDSEARYRILADHSSDIIAHSDLNGNLLFISPSISRVAGYDPRALTGSNLRDLIDPRDHQFVERQYAWAIVHPGEQIRFEYRGCTANGETRWFESVCSGVVGEDGGVEGIVSIVRDISDRKRKEDELIVAASTDPLTGIANRRAFRQSAEALIADPLVERTSLVLIDIDLFKTVNDRFGHEAGDEVLKSFCAIATRVLRRHDVFARIGGEEFAILFPGLDHFAAAGVCERIRSRVAGTTCATSAGPVRITFSGGVTELGDDGLDAALKRADHALYQAKASGRDRLKLAA